MHGERERYGDHRRQFRGDQGSAGCSSRSDREHPRNHRDYHRKGWKAGNESRAGSRDAGRRKSDWEEEPRLGSHRGRSWSSAKSSAWDAPSPSPLVARPSGASSSTPYRPTMKFDRSPAMTPSWRGNNWAPRGDARDRSPELEDEYRPDHAELKKIEEQLDREWYGQEEGGTLDETHDPFLGDAEKDPALQKRVEVAQKRLTRRDGTVMTLAQSKRASEIQKDMNAWEENRLLTSGVVNPLEVDLDMSHDSDVRVLLLVHDIRPPFLDGRFLFTKQKGPVMPLKDPTSDLAVIARNGSKLVKEIREKKDANKSRARFWEVAGSKIGKITGLTEEEKEEGKRTEEAIRREAGEEE